VSYAISLSGTTVSIASPGPRGVGVPTGGTTGQVLAKASATDYDFAWSSASGGLSNVVEDTTPQLGGNLDVNGQSIVSVSNGDIAITPNGTGSIILDGLTWPSADGSADQVLKTAGDGTLSFGDASTVAALNDLTDVSVGSEAPSDVLVYRSGSGWINDPLDYTEITSNVGSGSADHSGGTVAAGSITDVIALTNTQYTNLTSGADPNTLYVITDGTTSIADSDDVTITGTPAITASSSTTRQPRTGSTAGTGSNRSWHLGIRYDADRRCRRRDGSHHAWPGKRQDGLVRRSHRNTGRWNVLHRRKPGRQQDDHRALPEVE
jgi:hypothetical protein